MKSQFILCNRNLSIKSRFFYEINVDLKKKMLIWKNKCSFEKIKFRHFGVYDVHKKNGHFLTPHPSSPPLSTSVYFEETPLSNTDCGRPNFYQRHPPIKIFPVIFKDIIEILHVFGTKKKKRLYYVCVTTAYIFGKKHIYQ